MIKIQHKKVDGGTEITVTINVFRAKVPTVISITIADGEDSRQQIVSYISKVSRMYFLANMYSLSAGITSSMSLSGNPLTNASALRLIDVCDRVSSVPGIPAKEFLAHKDTVQDCINMIGTATDVEKYAQKLMQEYMGEMVEFATRVK